MGLISEIYVRGFRGVAEGWLRGLRQVTILVGRNGAGKSSILEALYLVSACASMWDEVRGVQKLDYLVSRRGMRGTWNGSRRVLWYMWESETPITVRLGIGGEILEFNVLDQPVERRPVRLRTRDGLLSLETDRLSSEESLGAHRVVGVEGRLAELRRLIRGFLLVDGVLAREPGKVEEYAWPRVAAKRLDKLLVGMVREEFEPEAEGLTYIPSGEGYYYLALQTSKTTVRVDDLGDGARAALLSSMLVLAYRPTVLLVEEPELHMHPVGLYTYMKFLFKLAGEMGFQVIASTHSLELIQFAKILSRETGVDTAVLYVEREGGVLEARSFSVDDVDLLRELGFDVRLLYKF